MSDFQDEQGLGELPADIYAQYLEQFAAVPGSLNRVPAESGGLGVPSSSPKYDVGVKSVFQTLPINAVEFNYSNKDGTFSHGSTGIVGSTGFISTQLYDSNFAAGNAGLAFDSDPGYITIIKKITWNVSPKRFFYQNINQNYLNIYVGGVIVSAGNNVAIRDSGNIDSNIICPENTRVQVLFNFNSTYGQIAPSLLLTKNLTPFCNIIVYGYKLLSRGLPAPFEIGSK